MTKHATGTFDTKDWDETPVSEIDGGGKLTHVSGINVSGLVFLLTRDLRRGQYAAHRLSLRGGFGDSDGHERGDR